MSLKYITIERIPSSYSGWNVWRYEHVDIIEIVIMFMKERYRCITHSIPKLMVQSLIACLVKWINAFPSKTLISSTMRTAMIVEGKGNPDVNHKHITFGWYTMVYTGTTNDMKISSVPYIVLNESNDHGGHYLMSLYTGKRLHSYQCTELPLDDDVIAQVRYLAEGKDSKQITDNYRMFEWAPVVLITDDVSEENTPIREKKSK